MPRKLKIFVLMYFVAAIVKIIAIPVYVRHINGTDVFGYFGYALEFIINSAGGIACGAWLYMFSSRDKLFWALFGFLGNLFSVLVFWMLEKQAGGLDR